MDNQPVRTAKQKAMIIKDGTARYELLNAMFATKKHLSSTEIAEITGMTTTLVLRTISKTNELKIARFNKIKIGSRVLFRLEEIYMNTQLYKKGAKKKEKLHFVQPPKPRFHLNERDRYLWSVAMNSFS